MPVWKVSVQHSGLTLQKFLKEHLDPSISSKKIKRSLDAGKCSINGRTERFASSLVGTGDRVAIEELEETKTAVKLSTTQILYSDADVLAYNKPAGITSDNPLITDVLNKQLGPVILLHRLDKQTSGVLLFARNEITARDIEILFKQRAVKKTYYAIVDGVPKKTEGKINDFLGKLHAYQGQTLWGSVSKEQGLPAVTAWNRKKVGKGASLLTCFPETGRTHQIRIHLSDIGHPILGDHQYGRQFNCSYKAPRILLHAFAVEFCYKTNIIVTAPLPADFLEAMKVLKLDG